MDTTYKLEQIEISPLPIFFSLNTKSALFELSRIEQDGYPPFFSGRVEYFDNHQEDNSFEDLSVLEWTRHFLPQLGVDDFITQENTLYFVDEINDLVITGSFGRLIIKENNGLVYERA